MIADTTTILLVGTGAVGGYYGGRLAQAGARVSALCRSDYDEVKKKGISVSSISGDFHFSPDRVIRDSDGYHDEPDYLIVAVKALPDIDLPALIGGGVGIRTSIVLLQNGIDIEDQIASSFPENELISALAFICASRPRYGHVEHQDFGKIAIGRYPSGTSEKVERLAGLFSRTVVPCSVENDIVLARWKKLLWNAPLNPISVLTGGANTKEIMESGPALDLVRGVMEEVILLAENAGKHVPRSLIDDNIRDTLAMKPFKTSMLQDFEEKRPMEVESILGNALRIARRQGAPVPRLESLYGLLSLADSMIRKGPRT
ncbi:MAG: 2-dehydropantoate 2-reductase [Chrysiogenales bacterium]|nr:MAG: 2-dehydropantoate 2-reductase [Chrysiogenales bacterium]